MGARSKARKRALDVLFSSDLRGIPLANALAIEAQRAAEQPARESSWVYAREIIEGVIDHATEIDEHIETFSRDWTLARMPAVDRAILRIAVWELLYNSHVPTSVALAEAVTAAQTLSTDESAGFVNGVLAAIANAHDAEA